MENSQVRPVYYRAEQPRHSYNDPIDLYAEPVTDTTLTEIDYEETYPQEFNKEPYPDPTASPMRRLFRNKRRKCAGLCVCLLLVFLILLLVGYFFIVPNIIRGKYRQSQIQMYPNTVDLKIDAGPIPKLHVKMDSEIFVHGTDIETKFDPEVWQITTGDGSPLLKDMAFPEKILYKDRRYPMTLDTSIVMGNLETWQRMFAQLSHPNGLDENLGQIQINTKLGVTLFGMHLYSNLESTKVYDLRGISFQKIFENKLYNKTLPGCKQLDFYSMI
jgi:hypothetical protein